MTTTGIYCRVSSEDQQERGTIENQIDFGTKYCDLHGIPEDEIAWYKDDGVTGTIPLEQRMDGSRLLEDAKSGKLKLLLLARLDRLGRSARIILNAVYELEQHGVKIRSMTEPFDTGDPSGRFLLTILAGVADLERETVLDRLWHGANRAARKGKWLGGIVPFGYRVNQDSYLEINEEFIPGFHMSEADVVILIFNQVSNMGHSTIKVADYLNALGIPPSYVRNGRQVKKGKRKENTAGIWRPGRIRAILTNSTYKGIHEYGKRSNKNRETILREVSAIVDEAIWDKAQLVLKENQLEATKNSKRNYLLRGLIKCGICGSTYQGVTFSGPEGTEKGYYICGSKRKYHGPNMAKCESKNVSREWVDEMVWRDCVNFIQNPGQALNSITADMDDKKSQKESFVSQKVMLLKAVEDKEGEKQGILDLYRKKIITSTDVESQLQKITQEKISLEEQINEIESLIKAEESISDCFSSAEELLSDLKQKIKEDSFEVRREIVRTLVKEINVATIPGNGMRPHAQISANYSFSNSNVVNCTDMDWCWK